MAGKHRSAAPVGEGRNPELRFDSNEATDIADPIDPAEANQPMLANEAHDAALPIERNESLGADRED